MRVHGEAFHLAEVDAADVRMNVRDIDRCAGEAFGQFVLLRLQLAKAAHEGAAISLLLRCDQHLVSCGFDGEADAEQGTERRVGLSPE